MFVSLQYENNFHGYGHYSCNFHCRLFTKNNQVYIDQQEYSNATIQTFQETGDALCTDEQGKPIIRFFATSWCPHCKWIKETYMGVMKKYIDEGKVTAYLWEVDTNDDLLRKGDQPIPSSEEQIFKRYNPKGSIPTFIFGCTYYRVGNGYEQQNNLAAEGCRIPCRHKRSIGNIRTSRRACR